MTTMTVTTEDERQAFRQAVRDFAQRRCGTREQRDALTDGWTTGHNQELYEEMAELGWLGCALPEELGGSGGGATDMCVFLEEMGRGQIPIAGYGTSVIAARAVDKFGTEEQRRTWVGGCARGEVLSIAMSEPEAGSDVGSLKCRAERVDGGFRINGQKTWISNAHHAARILLICRTGGGDDKHAGITMLDVPAGVEGMEARQIDTMGGRETNDLFFTDCFVPEDAVIGVEGQAWVQLMAGLNFERLVTAASHLGTAQRAFDDALAYIKERRQFGRPIGKFQTMKHRVADLATELECCRLLTYEVARRTDEDPATMLPREASMAKLKVTEVHREIALAGMQMMGGYGYATEYDMERHVRGALVGTIYAGTSEIQREIIGTTYGL